MIDSDARYLYYVLPDSKAIRYGVTVGEEALSFYGIAKVGRKDEWPTWTPTADIKKRLGDVPNFVEGGPHNPMGARGIYLFQGDKDTLFRIHGTNQPEYIGQAISSGCIRLTNEDVIDLYNRVKHGLDRRGAGAQAGRLAGQSAGHRGGDEPGLRLRSATRLTITDSMRGQAAPDIVRRRFFWSRRLGSDLPPKADKRPWPR